MTMPNKPTLGSRHWGTAINNILDYLDTKSIPESQVTNLVSDLASKAPLSGATFTGDVYGKNLSLSGNLTVGGTQTIINTTNLAVTDSLIYLSKDQYASDSVDIGIYGAYGTTGGTEGNHKHTGLIRDHSDGTWKFISNGTEPTANTVNLTGVNYDGLKVGSLNVTGLTTAGYVKTDSSGVISSSAAISPSDVTGTAVITTDSRLSDTRTPTNGSVTDAKVVSGGLAQSSVTGLVSALASKAPTVSPTFMGTVTTPLTTAGYVQTTSGGVLSSVASVAQADVSGLVSALAGKASLAGGNTFTEQQSISGSVAGTTVFFVKGAVSQSGDLTQWQNSSGSQLARVGSDGSIRSVSFGSTVAGNALLTPAGDTGGFLLNTQAAANKGVVIKGAASQTANLQEWQDSAGTVQASISVGGILSANGGYISQLFAGAGISGGTIGRLNVAPFSAAQVPAVVRGAASQSANLQEWQSSAGTVVASVSSSGNLNGAISFGGYRRHVTGNYYTSPTQGSTATFTNSLNRLSLVPFIVPVTTTYTRIAVTTGTAVAGSTTRLGIYSSDANDVPSTLVVDAGTVASVSASTFYPATISQTLTPGLYWLASVGQTASSNLRVYSSTTPMAFVPQGTIASPSVSATNCYITDNVTGALPSTLSGLSTTYYGAVAHLGV